jgi:hypothetical protein
MGNAALCPLGGAGEEMGGYKGYGWAAAVELLCTAFQHGPFGQQLAGVDRATGAKTPMPLGHVFLAIDVEAFTSLHDFKKSAGAVLVALAAPVVSCGNALEAGPLTISEHDTSVRGRRRLLPGAAGIREGPARPGAHMDRWRA